MPAPRGATVNDRNGPPLLSAPVACHVPVPHCCRVDHIREVAVSRPCKLALASCYNPRPMQSSTGRATTATAGRRWTALFWSLWIIDALVAAIVLYFFFEGLADGSVSSFNMRIWMLLLGSVAGVVIGSVVLRSSGRGALATVLAALIAMPAALAGLFLLVLLASNPRWN
jgi:hypothetical protein